MPKHTLDFDAIQEVRASLVGLSGTRAKQEAARWAKHHGLHVSRIYELTKDLRPPRKPRADKGKRRADLMEHPGMKTFAELVVTNKLDPDQAIEMARANGHDIPVALGTARRYLREHGLNRRQLRNGVRPHRRFEASAPGEIYQFDISGVKERWIDVKTRRILKVSPLEVSKNHPNTKVNRVALWKFTLVDDYSRKKFVRFIACSKPDSAHVIDFLLEAFREMGIPLVLYTDNDAIIVSRQMRRAASILDRAFAASGGFRLEQHLPGNPQATGKVEVAHQLVEKYERYIGAMDRPATVDDLNIFTVRLCEKVNWTAHRATGEMPDVRFRAGNAVMRVPPAETLNSAFKSVEFEREIRPSLTISYEGTSYQLPRGILSSGERNPFVDWIGKKVRIIWPTDADYFVLIGLDGVAYEIDRRAAQPDKAGQYRGTSESIGQRATKALRASADEKRAQRKAAGEEIIVPGIHKDFEIPALRPTLSGGSNSELSNPAISDQAAANKVAVMPRKKIATDPALLAALGNDIVPPSMVDGHLIDYWTALGQLIEEGSLTSIEPDKAWLKAQFGSREQILDTELRAALSRRTNETSTLAAIRRA